MHSDAAPRAVARSLDPAVKRAFQALSELEAAGERGSLVTDDGFFEYLRNMPVYSAELDFVKERDGDILYKVPRGGDVLIELSLEGTYESARFFQYDTTGSREIVYWEGVGDGGVGAVAHPFPKGIPMLQVGKALYLEAKGAAPDFKASCEFALLDAPSRRLIAECADAEGKLGIKLRHESGAAYQVYNVSDWCYSPNVLAPL